MASAKTEVETRAVPKIDRESGEDRLGQCGSS